MLSFAPIQYNIFSPEYSYKNSPAKIIVYSKLSLLDAIPSFYYDFNKAVNRQQS